MVHVLIVPDSSNYDYFLRLFLFDFYRICKHLKRISSSPVEGLPRKKQKTRKQQEFYLWEVVESVSCSYENKSSYLILEFFGWFQKSFDQCNFLSQMDL